MAEVNSWGFAFDLINKYNFIVFYGNDFALSLSLSRFIDSYLIVNESIDSLYSDNLWSDNPQIIRFIATTKFLTKLITSHNKDRFLKKVIAVVDGNILLKDHSILYVKCDKLNARSRIWFVNFHMKQLHCLLGAIPSWINNLDDLKFANILQTLECDFDFSGKAEFDIWSEVRKSQFQSNGHAKNMWKYFELWCRDNIPNNETMFFMAKKIENYLQSVESAA